VSARALAGLALGASLATTGCSSAAPLVTTTTDVRRPRACPPAPLAFLTRFRPHATAAPEDDYDYPDRWLLMLAARPAAAGEADTPPYTELDPDTARGIGLSPPAKLWVDDGDGTWCEATPAAVYRDVWSDGRDVGFEYGVELDATCSAPPNRDAVVRVAVAGPRPPAGCRVDTGVQDITARTVEWDVAGNTFEPPAAAPAIPDAVAAAIPPPPCTGACLALWHVSALMSHGAPAVWQVERAWVTPDRAELCNSSVASRFDVLVARGSAAVPLAIHPDGSGLDPDLFAALEDDGGVRVLVTSLPGEYATWDLDAMRLGRRLHWGFPDRAELAAAHELGPVCGR
jgi:hypothetical protein